MNGTDGAAVCTRVWAEEGAIDGAPQSKRSGGYFLHKGHKDREFRQSVVSHRRWRAVTGSGESRGAHGGR